MLRNTLFTFFVLIIIFAFNSNVYSQQLLIDENFDYDIGDLTSVSNGAWVNISGNENLIQVSEGSLSYSGYPSSGLQNKIDIISVSTSAEDAYTEFSPQGEGTTTYAGFLVNVANTTGLADNSSSDGDYFIGYLSSTSTTILRARVCIKLGTVVNTFQVGLIASSSITDAVWYNTDLDIGTTYLIVVSYQIITGSDNDIASLWINPPVDGAQPAADLIQTSASDLNEVGRFAVRQGNAGTPNASIDGIRIGTNWTAIFPDAFTPAISVSPSSLSGFTYLEGSGPSVSQSYDISGTDLTPESGNISIIGSTNYEVSSDNSNFTSNIDIAYSGGVLDATSVYVRLKAGLIGGAYDGELITNSGGSALTQNVTCSGFVTKPEPTNHVTAFAVVLGNPDYYYNNLSWIDATGGTEPDGYLIKRSSIDFSSIDDPIDGVPEDNSESVQNIAQGVQYAVFTGYANTTYYYKIYPYTNSGLYIDYKTDGAVPQFSITNASTPSLPLTENFEYPTGSNLTDNGWIAHSGDGTNPIQVNETPLSYSGYINSGIGKSVTMTTTGEDLNRAFTNVSSGSIYASFMVNILSAHTNGDYFFHLGSENSSSIYLARVFVKKDGNDNLSFGVAKRNDADAVYTSFDYALNATYLVVLKYSFNNGTADDDEVSLWINPVLNGTEPNATITQTDAGNDAENLGKMALRQGTSSNAAALILGGIRVADTWIPGSGVTTFQLTVDVSDGWNMVSVPGINPDGQGVDIWWPGKDPSADVYTYSSGYQAVTTTTPGEGYWMKHSGVNEYNTGDEWPACGIEIVAHDPIDAAEGWNMIGGYEIAASTSELTTTPPGLINSLIYGYSDGYQSASNLVPGYGYWIKLTGAGQINISSTFGKIAKAAKYFKDDWGKIIITDNAGRSFTLYAVNGETDLNLYELPPPPPSGMFDIRFSSGRIAEDINKSMQTIEMNGIKYPVKVKAEGIDIKLQDLTGQELNMSVKSGEEISVGNSSINKIMVSGNIIPDKYSLEQNYPNPFNPSTTIEFSLPENVKNVKLSIYNILGQRVAELVNASLQAGRYQYEWNAKNTATGMYIYELRTDKFVSVKKMILIK